MPPFRFWLTLITVLILKLQRSEGKKTTELHVLKQQSFYQLAVRYLTTK